MLRKIADFITSSLIVIALSVASIPAALATTITAANAAQPVTVSAAEPQLTIQLAANPTTGYSWFLQNPNPEAYEIIEHHYQTTGTAMPGAGGVESWTIQFRPAAFRSAQQFDLIWAYQRPWEKQTVKSITFHIVTTAESSS